MSLASPRSWSAMSWQRRSSRNRKLSLSRIALGRRPILLRERCSGVEEEAAGFSIFDPLGAGAGGFWAGEALGAGESAGKGRRSGLEGLLSWDSGFIGFLGFWRGAC